MVRAVMSQGAENTLVCGQERGQEECESDRVTATALSEDTWTNETTCMGEVRRCTFILC